MVLKIKRRNYFIPERWNQVTIGQFKQVLQLKPELLKGDEYYHQLLGIFTELEIDSFRDSFSEQEFQEIKDVLSFLLVSLPDEQTQLKTAFYLKGKLWSLQHDLSTLYHGAFLDLTMLIKNNEQNPFVVLDEMLAIIIRPVVKKKKMHSFFKRLFNKKFRNVYHFKMEDYDASKRKENAEFLSENINMEDAYSIGLFFWAIGKESLMNTSDSLKKMALVDMQTKEHRNSEKYMDGMPPL